MFYLYNLALLTTSTIITGGETAPAPAAEPTGAGAQAVEGAAGLFGGGGMSMILIYAAIIGGMYFLMIRPQRKRERALREMQGSLAVGDDVVTSSGFFGNIVSIGEDCFIIEFGSGKGVRIPVRKTDIIGKQSPNTTVNKT